MGHGFTRTHILDGLINDNKTTTPIAYENNLAVGSTALRTGTLLTAHATPHTKAASYTTLIGGTAVESYGLWITGHDVAANSVDTGILCDIATGAAGAEVIIINNIDFGQASTVGGGTTSICGNGKIFYFPGIVIPASTRISARIQATVTVDTVSVAIWTDNRAQWNISNAWTTYGANTATSSGTSTPEGNAAYGAWTNIATTSSAHKLWCVGYDSLGDLTISSTVVLIQLGHGATIGTVTTMAEFQVNTASTEAISGCFPPVASFALPTASLIWARIASADAENRGIIIYGN